MRSESVETRGFQPRRADASAPQALARACAITSGSDTAARTACSPEPLPMRSDLAPTDSSRAAVLESATLAQELKSYLANHRATLEGKVKLGTEEGGLPAAERLA